MGRLPHPIFALLGLAAKYLKDAGIGRDKVVLFHDDFEDGKIGAA